jgi:hypothetical protein
MEGYPYVLGKIYRSCGSAKDAHKYSRPSSDLKSMWRTRGYARSPSVGAAYLSAAPMTRPC